MLQRSFPNKWLGHLVTMVDCYNFTATQWQLHWNFLVLSGKKNQNNFFSIICNDNYQEKYTVLLHIFKSLELKKILWLNNCQWIITRCCKASLIWFCLIEIESNHSTEGVPKQVKRRSCLVLLYLASEISSRTSNIQIFFQLPTESNSLHAESRGISFFQILEVSVKASSQYYREYWGNCNVFTLKRLGCFKCTKHYVQSDPNHLIQF